MTRSQDNTRVKTLSISRFTLHEKPRTGDYRFGFEIANLIEHRAAIAADIRLAVPQGLGDLADARLIVARGQSRAGSWFVTSSPRFGK
jgi:hypothetical protein